MKLGEDAIRMARDGARSADLDREKVLAELAALPWIDYDQRRRNVAKAFNCRTSSLDADVEQRRTKQATTPERDTALISSWTVEPSTDVVDGANLLNSLSDMFRKYLVLPDGAADTLALWVLHAWTHEAADTSPLLVANSPEKRCGKTRLFRILNKLTPRPIFASNMSPASLFRVVEKFRPTLLIDEGDTFLRDSDELRGLINSGHDREGAFVWRTVGDDYMPQAFSTWAPKAIALIGRLPDTIEDRAIIISMKRKLESDKLPRFERDDATFKQLRSRSLRWALSHIDRLKEAEPVLPSTLDDRAADHWAPLLAIADAAGADWPQRGREASRLLSGRTALDDSSAGTMLLSDMKGIFEKSGDRVSSTAAVAILNEMEHRPWPEWRRGKPLSPRQLAALLKPFKIEPRTIRLENATPKGYVLADFEDAFDRYLPPNTATLPQITKDEASSQSLAATDSAVVADGSLGRQFGDNDCGVVVDAQGSSDTHGDWETV
jgi:putative DNA primase/helicase